jgi:hypothetical protein
MENGAMPVYWWRMRRAEAPELKFRPFGAPRRLCNYTNYTLTQKNILFEKGEKRMNIVGWL